MIKTQITYENLIRKLGKSGQRGQEVVNDFPVYVKTPDGFSKINAVIEKQPEAIQRTTFTDGTFVESSKRHIFLSNGVNTFAEDVEFVDTLDGRLDVIGKETVAIEPTFDISIGAPHIYISNSENNILHHNTYLALGMVRNFIDTFEDGIVFYFESESAITKKMLQERGIDLKRLAIIPVVTVQDFKIQAVKIIDLYEKTNEADRKPVMFVLDSMGMLSTDKEIADSSAGNDTKDMTRAQQLKAVFRILTLRLGRANIPLIVTNHTYDEMGGSPYANNIQYGGGKGAVYASSVILTLTKAKEKDSANNLTGVIITVTAQKSRFTREGTKVKCRIKFDGGLDKYFGLLELGEAAGVFKKVSTRYELESGEKVFGKQILEHPEKYFTDDVLLKIGDYTRKAYAYGSSYELPEDLVDEEVKNDD